MGDRIFTLPNLVSFARLAAIPYFWWVLLGEDRVGLAAALIFVIGGTDWVDGYLARRLNQISRLGTMLDPVADRLMIASALVGGLMAGIVPLAIGVLLLVREVYTAGLTLLLKAREGGTLSVRMLGKLSTFLLYGAIPSFYLLEADIAAWLFGPPAWIAGVVGLVMYWWVAVEYTVEVRGRLRSLESSPTDQEV
jgi:cardiolipin synthase (CMP-forming)